jgi:hypothetical protein
MIEGESEIWVEFPLPTGMPIRDFAIESVNAADYRNALKSGHPPTGPGEWARPDASLALRAAGVALPPTVRQLADA